MHELARRHGDRARVTVVVRAGRLPGGAAVYTDDDLREAVERFRLGRERELPECGAMVVLLRQQLRET